MSTDFNNLIRNKIRDFIGGKKWSVSRFASRYVEAYSEIYSRREAPSTSTARKLVEEDGHVYTEREIIVLDSFTNMELYQNWLEGQKIQLIERSNNYYGSKDSVLSIDSPAQFSNTLTKLNSKNVQLTLADVNNVVLRYAELDSSKPLLLMSESQLLMEEVIKIIPQRYSIVCIDAEKSIIPDLQSIIASASKGEKVFGIIVSSQYGLFDRVKELFGSDMFMLRFEFSDTMIESSLHSPDLNSRANRAWLVDMVNKCLDLRLDLPPLFSAMMRACASFPWVFFPEYESTRQIMDFIETIYSRMSPIFEDDRLSAELGRMIETGIPEKWLMDDCDQCVLLEYLCEFPLWRAEKLAFIETLPSEDVSQKYREALKSTEEIDIDALKLWGNTVYLFPGAPRRWFDKCFNANLVEVDLMKVIDIALTLERHSRLK